LLSDPYRPVERLIDYCKEPKQSGERISTDPEVQEILTKAFVDKEILRLLRLRNYWMGESNWLGTPTKKRMTYEGSQVAMYQKVIGPRIADAMLKTIGPAALIADSPWAPLKGAAEFYHRHSIVRLHPGGTVEIQKLRVFRGLIGSETRIGSG
jgi:alkylation response protein AidB-like acyl-CoA dehydrogenase